jgi:hypothetical protein
MSRCENTRAEPLRPRVFALADKPHQWRVSVLRLLPLRRPPLQRYLTRATEQLHAVLEFVRTAQTPTKPGDIARQIDSTWVLIRHDLEYWRQQGRVPRDV